MLPKKSRIPRKLFKPLLGSRQFFNSEHFSLRTAESGNARLSVSVSKKVSKKAVVRNRVRRRVYSAARELMPSLPSKLFLLAAKSGALKIKGESLKLELADLLKKG
ncbi:MAG: ribonuclease P protein component [Parcubacteria group bacterium]